MAWITPEQCGMPDPLSNEELRRLALLANKDVKKISRAEAEAMNKELNKFVELEKQKMKEFENRFKK